MPVNQTPRKSLEQVVHDCGRYPMEAFEFVRHGLTHTVHQLYGDAGAKAKAEGEACHVSGQQLCWGLRNYAVHRYGLLARTVLAHWNIVRTNDFGRIVFAMVDSRLMQKTDDDDIRDFDSVFDFATAFDPPTRPAAAPKPTFSI
ncbi:MAG TPA: Minf_1886 family protein [Phycisphaerae bacterium]|nr:Minf_1886 family protein [Phycisphaerae bacterium]